MMPLLNRQCDPTVPGVVLLYAVPPAGPEAGAVHADRANPASASIVAASVVVLVLFRSIMICTPLPVWQVWLIEASPKPCSL
jgi:hypothetical protein